LGAAGLAATALGLRRGRTAGPSRAPSRCFLSGYLGLAAGSSRTSSPTPWTSARRPTPDNALSLILIGAAILLPAIIGYSLWVYWIFRGKVGADAGYH